MDSQLLYLTTVAISCFNIYYHWDSLLQIVSNLEYVAYGCIAICCVCVTGNVFSYIEQPKLFGMHQNSKIFFYPGFHSQFQVETYVLTIMYFIMTMSMVYVIEGRRLILNGKSDQGVVYTIAASSVLFLTNVFWFVTANYKLNRSNGVYDFQE